MYENPITLTNEFNENKLRSEWCIGDTISRP